MTKEDKVVAEIINKMFEIAGHDVTLDDIINRKDDWYTNWTMTMEQYEHWKGWGSEYLRKTLRLRKEAAEKQMAWFALNYGLKFSDL